MQRFLLSLLGLCATVTEFRAAATECGKQQVSMRIYGGTDAVLGQWPWHVSLSYLGDPLCGGTLLSEQWVLSAAHCFAGNETFSDPKLWTVYLSYTVLNGNPADPEMVERGMKQILMHERYTNFINGYDIALVELAQPVPFSKTIGPVCLPLANHRFRLRSSCWVTGLEDVRPEGNLSSARPLQQVSITLIGRKTCNCIYNSLGRATVANPVLAGMICGTDKDGERGPCYGDSGGPVVCNEEGVWFLAGIVSFSLACHLPNTPNVFTEVSTFAEWIESKTATAGAAGPAFFTNQTIPVSGIPIDDNNCTDLLSTKNPGCGVPNGNHTEPGAKFPWSLAMFYQGSYRCEGTLVSESWLLAAAHCFVGPDVSESPEDWTVALGSPPTMATLERISINGAFIEPPEGRDIAMLQLKEPVVFGDYLQPICVPLAEHRFQYGTTCVNTDHSLGAGTELQETPLQLIGPNNCNCIYSQTASANQSVSLLPAMICAAPQEGSSSACPVGGPLVCNENGAYFLAGLYSFGGGCAEPSGPAVFTDVSGFEEYIRDMTLEAYFAPQAITVPPGLDSGNCSEASDSVCGQPADAERKPGTGDAPKGAWPWAVSIDQYGSHYCSGVLISKSWVLSDSRCFATFPLFVDDYTVYLGPPEDASPTELEMSRKVIRVVHHPDFRRFSDDNYLALIELSPDVIYNDFIRPICLPTADVHIATGSDCWTTGWGDIQPAESFPVSSALKELAVSMLDANNCSCQYEDEGPSNEMLKRTICAGDTQGPTAACLGDKGKPLVCQDTSGAWLLAGLASSRADCTDPPCPTVYTAAAPFDAWIRETVSGDAQFISSPAAFTTVSTTERTTTGRGPAEQNRSASTTAGHALRTEVATTSTATPVTTTASTAKPVTTTATTSTAKPVTSTATTSTAKPVTSTATTSTTKPVTTTTTKSTAKPVTTTATASTAKPVTTTATTSTAKPVTTTTTAIPVTSKSIALLSAASQKRGCLWLHCILGVLYLMFASR